MKRQRTTKWIDPVSKKQVPANTPGAEKRTYKSKKWYGKVEGRWTPLLKNKAASLQMLARLRSEAEAGLGGQHQLARTKLLAEHLDEYEQHAKTRRTGKRQQPPSAKHIASHLPPLRRLILSCGDRPPDITVERCNAHLAERMDSEPLPDLDRDAYRLGEMRAILGTGENFILKTLRTYSLPWQRDGRHRLYPRETLLFLLSRQRKYRGLAPGSAATLAARARRFGEWLARRCGWAINPLADLKGAGSSLDTDHRHDRRSLAPEALELLLNTTGASARVSRGLSGPDRRALYLCAAGTGLRVSELAELRPEWFAFDGSPPTVTLPGRLAKNGKATIQPMPDEVAVSLREWMRGKAPGVPVWPGTWSVDAAELLSGDLREAGIPYAVAGPEGLLYADFHALRHTYIAALDRAGVSLKVAMQLARHSKPELTARVYGKAELPQLGAAVQGLTFGGKVTPRVTPAIAAQDQPMPSIAGQDQPTGGKTPRRKPKGEKEKRTESETE